MTLPGWVPILFESYVGSIIGTMILGAAFIGITESGATAALVQGQNWSDGFNSLSAVLLPLVLAGTGIFNLDNWNIFRPG